MPLEAAIAKHPNKGSQELPDGFLTVLRIEPPRLEINHLHLHRALFGGAFGQALWRELNGKPGTKKFTFQPETSVPRAMRRWNLPAQDTLDLYSSHSSQSVMCGLNDLA